MRKDKELPQSRDGFFHQIILVMSIPFSTNLSIEAGFFCGLKTKHFTNWIFAADSAIWWLF